MSEETQAMTEPKKRGRKPAVEKTEPIVEVAVAEESTAKKPQSIKNASRFPWQVYTIVLQPGGEYTPTPADLKNERGTKRVENAIAKGYLERV